MNKQIPSGYLGLTDVILNYARFQQPELWNGVDQNEMRIWERLRRSVDAWKTLDQQLNVEFERSKSQDVYDRKDSFLEALAEIRDLMYDNALPAVVVSASWHLGDDVFDLYEPPALPCDFWLDDTRANQVLLSGVFSPTADGTHAGDLLILLPKEHVTALCDLQRRMDAYLDSAPACAPAQPPADAHEQAPAGEARGADASAPSSASQVGEAERDPIRRKRSFINRAQHIEALRSLYPEGDPIHKGLLLRKELQSKVAGYLGIPVDRVGTKTLDRARDEAWT